MSGELKEDFWCYQGVGEATTTFGDDQCGPDALFGPDAYSVFSEFVLLFIVRTSTHNKLDSSFW